MQKESGVSLRAVLFTVCLAQFLVPLMFSAVSVSLPSLGRELRATALQLGLVVQLYALALAASMLTFGRLGDVLGRKRVFLAGLLLFTVVTTSLGWADNMELLIALRFLQGMSAAILLSCSMALVVSVFPVEMRGRVLGVVSGFTFAGVTLGPMFGGFVTSNLGWRWVFWMAVPPGALACLWGYTRMPGEWREEGGSGMDWSGCVLYAASVSLAMLGASHLGDRLFLGGGMILAGLAGLAWFLARERHSESPLLDVTLFTSSRMFTMSCVATMGVYAATMGVMFFMSLYLQVAKGLTPGQTGFVLLTQPLLQTVAAPVAGRWADRSSPEFLANAGMAVCTAGLLLAAFTLGADTPLWVLIIALALVGLGVGVFITPNTVVILNGVEPRRYGMASGIVGTMRTTGLAVSMTTATVVFSLFMGGQAVSRESLPGFLSSMQTSLVAFAMFSCVGLGAGLGRRGRKKA